jgi:hypothetical protein
MVAKPLNPMDAFRREQKKKVRAAHIRAAFVAQWSS